MSASARDSLAAIAARAGVKTRAANLSYRGVRENFERRASFKLRGFQVELFAGGPSLYALFKREGKSLWSTPRPDPILGLDALLGQVAGHDVFVSAQKLGSPIPWIYRPDVVAALQAVEVRDEELFTFDLGGASALLSTRGGDADWRRLELIAALLELAPAGTQKRTADRRALPEDLRDLHPLLEKWGKTDDAERSDLVERADNDALDQLVNRVRPKLGRIAEFLSDTAPQDADLAGSLDALAQAAMEAEREIARRVH